MSYRILFEEIKRVINYCSDYFLILHQEDFLLFLNKKLLKGLSLLMAQHSFIHSQDNLPIISPKISKRNEKKKKYDDEF